MRVYLDNSIFFLQEKGGISTYWKEILKLSNYNGITIGTNTKFLSLLAMFVGRFKRAKLLMGQLLRLFPVVVSNRFDVVHSSYYRRPWILYRGSYVITIHDMIPELFYTGLRKKRAVNYKRRAIEKADKIICVSESTRRDLLMFYPKLESKKIVTILHGSRQGHASKQTRNMNQIVYIGGRKEGYKNFRKLIHALGDSNFHLVIVGSALTISERAVLQEVLPDRFSSLVFPSNNVVDKILGSSLALLYPSEYEGFGLPVLEAMSLGTPVVCKEINVFKELFSGAAIFTDFEEAERLNESLNLVRNEFGQISQMSIELNDNYCWEKSRKEHLELYKAL